MTSQRRLTITRIVLLALMFRVGIGFGHGPMVAPPTDLVVQGFCGPPSDIGQPAIPYQGCPICHALSQGADVDPTLAVAPSAPLPRLLEQSIPARRHRAPDCSRHHPVNLPRAPPSIGLV